MKLNAQTILYFLSAILMLAGIFTYILPYETWYGLFITSYIALNAAVGISIIEQLDFGEN